MLREEFKKEPRVKSSFVLYFERYLPNLEVVNVGLRLVFLPNGRQKSKLPTVGTLPRNSVARQVGSLHRMFGDCYRTPKKIKELE
jgi:hypothetical protein